MRRRPSSCIRPWPPPLATAVAFATCCPVVDAGPRDEWRWDGSVELAYDDNVFRYSDRDIATFESGTSPERFGFESVGDFVLTTQVSAEKAIRRDAGERTDLEADLRVRLHLRDSEANDVRLRVGLQHLFDQRHWVRLRFSYLPGYFVRRLYDADAGAFAPAEFDYTGATAVYWQRFSKAWSGEAGASWERRNYNSGFNERDADDLGISASVKYSPSDLWDVWLGFATIESSARGTSRGADVGVDTSNDEHVWNLGVRYQPSNRGYWQVEWERSSQDYESRFTPAQDPWHAGRRDREDALGLRYQRQLGPHESLRLEWRRESSSSRLPPSPTAIPRDESLSYDRNVYGVEYRTEF